MIITHKQTEIMEAYIGKLHSKIVELGGTVDDIDLDKGMDEKKEDDTPMPDADETKSRSTDNDDDDEDYPPLYEGDGEGGDFEKAGDYKMEADDLKSDGKWEEALEKYTAAVVIAPPSALLYANRAYALNKLKRFKAAERDCNEALKLNPDSAKALRVRGRYTSGIYEIKSLSNSLEIAMLVCHRLWFLLLLLLLIAFDRFLVVVQILC